MGRLFEFFDAKRNIVKVARNVLKLPWCVHDAPRVRIDTTDREDTVRLKSSASKLNDSNPRKVSIRVPRARIGSILEKDLHDLLLLGARSLRAGRARRMRNDVERGRALPAVSRVHTSAALEETADGLGTPCANRSMQWSRARLVLVLDVRPRVEKELNHRPLFGRVPRLSCLGPRIARVVERGFATPILGVRVAPASISAPTASGRSAAAATWSDVSPTYNWCGTSPTRRSAATRACAISGVARTRRTALASSATMASRSSIRVIDLVGRQPRSLHWRS